MESIPARARVFFYSIYATAAVALLISLLKVSVPSISKVIFFAVLILFADSFTIPLPKKAYITVSFAIIFATIIILGPWVAAIASMITAFNASDIRNQIPWYKMLFSACNYTISSFAAGSIYLLAGGTVGVITIAQFPFIIIPFLLATTVFFMINTSLIAIAIWALYDEPTFSTWRTNFEWLIPNYYVLGIFGFILAQMYIATGPASIILLVIPLVIARTTFVMFMKLRTAYLDTVTALVQALEAKDPYTRGHSERVAQFAIQIAQELRISDEEVETLKYAALLHDIGKIGITRRILNKPGRLTEEEFYKIKAHPEIGAEIIGNIDFLQDAIPAVYFHHEHLNGRGYARGLVGEEIPLLARIMTVADSYDAMTSTRSYRPALTTEEAINELMTCCGRQFDPAIVDAFINTLNVTFEEESFEIKELQLEIAAKEPV